MATTSLSPPATQDAGRSYTKRMRWAAEIKFLLFFGAVLAYASLGLHERVAALAQSITHNFALQLLFCWLPLSLIVTIATFPAAFYTFRLQRKLGLLTASFSASLRDLLKASAIALVTGAALIEVTFLSNTAFQSFGWLCATLTYSLLFFAFTQSLTWIMSLFYPVVPLADLNLRERLGGLAARAGLRVGTLYEWKISKRTRQANALVVGTGSARRILLTDTLISQLSPEEVEAIVAHELGHSARHHVAKRILLFTGIFALLFVALNFAVHNGLVCFAGSGSVSDTSTRNDLAWSNLNLIPGVFLYWSFGRVYGTLLIAALARRQEKEADLYAWNLIGRVEPFITGLRKLSDTNLVVYDEKSEWKYLHPAIAGRLAAAERFAKARGEIFSIPVTPAN